jgi:hypothetical protein
MDTVILDLRGQVLALESAREDNPDIPFGGQEGTWQSFLYTGTECLEIPALIAPGRYRPGSGQDIRGDAQPSQLAAQVLKLVVPVPAPQPRQRIADLRRSPTGCPRAIGHAPAS